MDHRWLVELQATVRDRQIDLDGLLREVTDHLTRRLDAERGTLYLVDHARGMLVARVTHLPDVSELRLRLGDGVAGWVATTGALVHVPATSPNRPSLPADLTTRRSPHSLLVAPVRGPEGTSAVVELQNKRDGPFTAADGDLLLELCEALGRLLEATSLGPQLRPGVPHPLSYRYNGIVGESPAMRDACERTSRAAPTDAPVLLCGEPGVGLELFARAVHHNSRRRGGPLVKVDCAATPAARLEPQLFGHPLDRGAGADGVGPGKVAEARGGTLLLAGVGALPPWIQDKLLKLIQDRTYLPAASPGHATPLVADVRLIATSHHALDADAQAGRFRRDLLLSLREAEIEVPPLRHRGHADIDRTIDHLLHRLTTRDDRRRLELCPDARASLHAWPWPCNVRELRDRLEAAILLAPGDRVTRDLLTFPGEPAARQPNGASPGSEPTTSSHPEQAFTTALLPLEDVERAYVRWVVERCEGNRTEAARRLAIGRNTLARRLREGEEGP